jgi:hypothetical protein
MGSGVPLLTVGALRLLLMLQAPWLLGLAWNQLLLLWSPPEASVSGCLLLSCAQVP